MNRMIDVNTEEYDKELQKYNRELQKTTEMLQDQIEVSHSVLLEFSNRNRELRKHNEDIRTRLRRVETENAQCVKTMQMMLKIINICESRVDNFLNSKLEENHKIAEAKNK